MYAGMSDEPTKDELKEQARKAGLPLSGTKDELKERLATVEDEGRLIGGAVRAPTQAEATRMSKRVREGLPVQEGRDRSDES
jgi:hypothetical protein